ncbi:Swi5-domain-containing protein [Usnea florida]
MSSSPTSTPESLKPKPPPPASPVQAHHPLEAKKIVRLLRAALEAKIALLETQIQETEEKRRAIDAQLKTKDAQATVKAHIKLLHDYNEIRDVGQGLMGIIADNRGVRAIDVYRDFDVGEGD